MTEKKTPTGDYETGYCRPPEATRFKKGAPSGNAYGRKGKPENREKNAAKKRPPSIKDLAIAGSRKRRSVRTPSGEIQSMTTGDILLEALVQGGLKNPSIALRALEWVHSLEKAEAREAHRAEEKTLGGVMVIQQPAATMAQSLERAKQRQAELRALGPAHAPNNLASLFGERGPSYPDGTTADPREERAYGAGALPNPRQAEPKGDSAPASKAVPLQGPNTKPTKLYR